MDESEKWIVEGRCVFWQGDVIAMTEDRDDEMDEAGRGPIARGIGACLNACAGIPTEALEDGAVGKLVEVMAWAEARLAVDGGMTELEQARTACRLRVVLAAWKGEE